MKSEDKMPEVELDEFHYHEVVDRLMIMHNHYYDDIIKYFVALEGVPPFEIEANTEHEAREYITRNFRGSGEVKLLVVQYRAVTTTPYIIDA